MKTKFISHIRKGNKKGTGFLYIPQDKTNLFSQGNRVKVELFDRIHFFSKIAKSDCRLGIYIPKNIMLKNDFLDKEAEVSLNKIDGFYSKMDSDGIIHIPKEIIKNQKINPNDVILIKGIIGNKTVKEKYSQVRIIKRKNRLEEYICIFDKNFYGKEFTFQIEKKTSEKQSSKISSVVKRILKNFHSASVNKNSIIIFNGRKIPAIINPKLKYSDIAFYLGAYFADGTKKGNSWAICASTFEQARYYLKMHNLLIKDSKNPEFVISYTNINNINENILKKRLTTIWRKQTDIQINKFRIRKPTGKLFSKWNQYGTLIIREHKQILLDFYNALLKSLIKKILLKKDKKLAIDFICGVMEGDGSAPAKKRGHVTISTNKNEIHILEEILKITQMEFKVVREDENKYTLRIGAFEILRNFHFLKDRIFNLYPKRRKRFFERLNTVGAVKFLTGNHEPTNWVKQWLRNNGFSDKNNRITQKGLKFGNFLLDEVNKV